MPTSASGSSYGSSADARQTDLAVQAALREEQAAALDHDLSVKVGTRETVILAELRAAARQALEKDQDALALKGIRDSLLEGAIACRLLLLTDQVKVGDLDWAIDTIEAIQGAYAAKTQLRVERTQFLRVSAVTVVPLQEVKTEVRERLHELRAGIADLRRIAKQESVSAARTWRRIGEVIAGETDPARGQLMGGELSAEAYADLLSDGVEAALNELEPEGSEASRRHLRREASEAVGLGMVSSAIWTAIWEGGKYVLKEQPWKRNQADRRPADQKHRTSSTTESPTPPPPKHYNRLREIREMEDISKAELARAAGVSVQKISETEAGDAARRNTAREYLIVMAINWLVSSKGGGPNKYTADDLFPDREPTDDQRRRR